MQWVHESPSDDTGVEFSMSERQLEPVLVLVSVNEGSTACWVSAASSDGAFVISRTGCTDSWTAGIL